MGVVVFNQGKQWEEDFESQFLCIAIRTDAFLGGTATEIEEFEHETRYKIRIVCSKRAYRMIKYPPIWCGSICLIK